MAIFDGCCCCFTLRTGVLIIGWMSLVGSLMYVGTGAKGLVHIQESLRQEKMRLEDDLYDLDDYPIRDKFYRDMMREAKLRESYESHNSLADAVSITPKQLTRGLEKALIIFITYSVVRGLCDVLLICGVTKEKAALLLPWVVIQSLQLAIVTVVLLGVCAIIGAKQAFTLLTLLVSIVISLGVALYYILVVYSYYQVLRDKARNSENIDATDQSRAEMNDRIAAGKKLQLC